MSSFLTQRNAPERKKLKILLVGATGTIGTAVSEALTARGHEVLPASRSGGIRVDVEQPATLDAVFDSVPGIEHVVCCAGSGSLVPVDGGTDEEFIQGLQGKLLGQAPQRPANCPAASASSLTGRTLTP
jgi:NAD(P)-dependent dehydrogenase (short-subunit alcohol dehydrogenase family)